MEPTTPSKSHPAENKVRVIVRVRPLIREELESNPEAKKLAAKVYSDQHRIALCRPGVAEREFAFDRVASHDSTTQESFYQASGEPLVNDLFAGYNATIIAYGQVETER